jgi:hypothetical protein
VRVGNQPSSPEGCVPGSVEEAGGQRDQALAGGCCETREGLSTSPQCVTRAFHQGWAYRERIIQSGKGLRALDHVFTHKSKLMQSLWQRESPGNSAVLGDRQE